MRFTTCLKPCVTIVASALFMNACQSVSNSEITTSSVISDSARQMFDNSGHSPSLLAKQAFITALMQHLASERYAVSNYYTQVVPIYDDNSIDKGSDSIWTTALKTYEELQHARRGNYQPWYYRSAVDYLYPREDGDVAEGEATLMGVDLSELPYLRYDDEMAGNTPDTVTRAVGMSEDYQAHNALILNYSEKLWDCAEASSERLGELVRANPDITIQDARVKAIKKRLDNCSSDATDIAKTLLKGAQGYQKSDIVHLQSCLSDYRTGFGQIMSATRKPKSLTGKAFDGYESLYGNFKMCNYSYYRSQPLEPYRYVDNYGKAGLDLFAQTKACESTALAEQRELQHYGKGYAYHADKFLASHYAQIDCVGQAIADVYGEESPNTPTSMAIAQERMDEQTDQVNSYLLHEQNDDGGDYAGITGWYKAYKHTKTQDNASINDKPDVDLGKFGRFDFISMMLEHMKQTPEQTLAKNLYQYNNTSITSLSHHRPQVRNIKTLWSLDYQSPTAVQSAQLPFIIDMNAGALDADISAVLPALAFITPKNTPLPAEIPAGQMRIALPQELSQKIPTAIIYDAVQQGIVAGYAEITPQKFTAVNLKDDSFAHKINAAQAVKIELNIKELGKLYATIAKYVVRDLKAYVDKNPTLYPNTPTKEGDSQADKIKKLIDEFIVINKGYRTSDVGGLLQVIEGITPFGFDNVNYIYLDTKGRIIGIQNIANIDDEIGGARLQTVGQTRFGRDIFVKHPLAAQFDSSFDNNTSFDGIAWLKSIKNEYEYRRQARQARLEYPYQDEVDGGVSNKMDASYNMIEDEPKTTIGNHKDRNKTAEIFYQKEYQVK